MKVLAALIISLVSFLLVGCNENNTMEVQVVENITSEETPCIKETHRIAYGRYYTNGTVITNDGNEWLYSTREISGEEPYDGMPVAVVFLDNGTTEIEDDVIKGIVFDRETAIYDALEMEMQNEDWEIVRNGNEIRISITEEGKGND